MSAATWAQWLVGRVEIDAGPLEALLGDGVDAQQPGAHHVGAPGREPDPVEDGLLGGDGLVEPLGPASAQAPAALGLGLEHGLVRGLQLGDVLRRQVGLGHGPLGRGQLGAGRLERGQRAGRAATLGLEVLLELRRPGPAATANSSASWLARSDGTISAGGGLRMASTSTSIGSGVERRQLGQVLLDVAPAAPVSSLDPGLELVAAQRSGRRGARRRVEEHVVEQRRRLLGLRRRRRWPRRPRRRWRGAGRRPRRRSSRRARSAARAGSTASRATSAAGGGRRRARGSGPSGAPARNCSVVERGHRSRVAPSPGRRPGRSLRRISGIEVAVETRAGQVLDAQVEQHAVRLDQARARPDRCRAGKARHGRDEPGPHGRVEPAHHRHHRVEVERVGPSAPSSWSWSSLMVW